MTEDFDGVFRFTNPTDEDFKFLWNSQEYTFLAQTTTPMVIGGETPENVQEIRKRAAYQLAVREFYKGDLYKHMAAQGGTRPALYDDKLLQPLVDKCLSNLPIGKLTKVPVPSQITEEHIRGSVALRTGEDPQNFFKDKPVQEFGMMPNL